MSFVKPTIFLLVPDRAPCKGTSVNGRIKPASSSGDDTLDLVTIINEFEKVTKEELDFRIEAANTKFFRDVVLTEGTVTCPRVIDELTTERNKLKEDMEYLCAKYMNVSSLSEIDFSALLGEVCDLGDKHHIEMPGRYTMLVRSFLTIEGVMEQLCPELNLFEVISDKLMERMKKSFSLEQEVLSLGKGILDVSQKVSKIPQLCADTLSDIMKGRLKINLELTGYEELISQLGSKIDDVIFWYYR